MTHKRVVRKDSERMSSTLKKKLNGGTIYSDIFSDQDPDQTKCDPDRDVDLHHGNM